jgi:hypothetical protein
VGWLDREELSGRAISPLSEFHPKRVRRYRHCEHKKERQVEDEDKETWGGGRGEEEELGDDRREGEAEERNAG